MRNYLYFNVLPSWSKGSSNKELISVFKNILTRRYVSLSEQREYAYMFFNKLKPEHILKTLHEENSNQFIVNPDVHDKGFVSWQYLPRLLTYMGVSPKDVQLIDEYKNKFYASITNYSSMKVKIKENEMVYFNYNPLSASKYEEKPSKAPSIIVLYTNNAFEHRSSEKKINMKMSDTRESITFMGHKYVCTSLLLTNFNSTTCKRAHMIAGVTCNDNRYMYNGWMSTTVDRARRHSGKSDIALPCELMKFDWLSQNTDFCIRTSQCGLKLKTSKTNLCFNVDNGDRTYIYVREDYAHKEAPATDFSLYTPTIDTHVTPKATKTSKTPKECPQGKIVNPVTNRCVKIDGAIGKKILARAQHKA